MISGAQHPASASRLHAALRKPCSGQPPSPACRAQSLKRCVKPFALKGFGLSFGLALAGGILLATLSFGFTHLVEDSDVIAPADQEQITAALEDNAQLVSTTQLEELLADQPGEVQEEIIQINSDAGDLALQVAMLIPVLACLLGFAISFRMARLPDFKPSAAAEGLLGG